MTASTCGHVFCRCCFAKVLEHKQCHVCSTVRSLFAYCIHVPFCVLSIIENTYLLQSTDALSWRDHSIPAGIQNPQDQLLLVGYSLENCISLCLAGIQFKSRQDELYAKLKQNKLQQRMLQAENHYKKKIGSMTHGYTEMQQQNQLLRKEKQELEADIVELREKYGQKAKEAHSLRQQASGGIVQTEQQRFYSGSQAQANTPGRNVFPSSVSPHHRAVARTLSTPIYGSSSPSALISSRSPYDPRSPGNRVHRVQGNMNHHRGSIGAFENAGAYDSPMERQQMHGYPVLQHVPGQLPRPPSSITPAKRRLGTASPLIVERQYPQRGYSQPMMSHLGLPPAATQ